MSTRLTFTGGPKMKSLMQRIAEGFPDDVLRALRFEAERIMTRSKTEFVPHKLGTLQSSGKVHPVERQGDQLSVTLSYGGAASAYAEAIHEEPIGEHWPGSWKAAGKITFTKSGTGHKYLERPFNEALPGMDERIAKEVSP